MLNRFKEISQGSRCVLDLKLSVEKMKWTFISDLYLNPQAVISAA